MKKIFFLLALTLALTSSGQTFLGFMVVNSGPQLEEANAGVVVHTRVNLSNKDTIVIPLSTWSGTYKRFEILLNGVRTDQWTDIEMRVSDDGGTTYDAGASDYGWNYRYGWGGADGADTDDAIVIMKQVQSDNVTSRTMNVEIKTFDPASTTAQPLFEYTGAVVWANDQTRSFSGGGRRIVAQATTHVVIKTGTAGHTMDVGSLVVNAYTY